MYDGTGIAEVGSRTVEIGAHVSDTIEMAGWFACNGLVSTPNLIDKFIRGSDYSGILSGSHDAVVVQHNHVASQGAHYHDVRGYQTTVGGNYTMVFDKSGGIVDVPTDSKTPGITVNNEGVSGINANMPYNYTVIFIIRMS